MIPSMTVYHTLQAACVYTAQYHILFAVAWYVVCKIFMVVGVALLLLSCVLGVVCSVYAMRRSERGARFLSGLCAFFSLISSKPDRCSYDVM